MVREIEVIEEGFENVVETLKSNIAEVENAKAVELKAYELLLDEKYGNRLKRYKEELTNLVHIETIEEPETTEEVVEETTEAVQEGSATVCTEII